MLRRHLLLLPLACCAGTRVRAQDAAARPRQKLSAATLHDALSARFPVRFGVEGLLQLEITAPALLLLPPRNKLGASLVAQASRPALPPTPPGALDIVFGLRYEPRDRTVRAQDPQVLDVRWPGLPPDAAQVVQGLLPAMAREAVGEIVLHQFAPADLALPDTMGFVPDTLTVVDDGVVLAFRPKPGR